LNVDPSGSVFVGSEATEEKVKSLDLSTTRILVFATHGLAAGDLNGLNEPALALTSPAVSGDEESDGLLTMSEILGLDLNADWVVLSACNTAASDGSGAEAVSGLGRAFFYAGTRSLLVSHWPVHSQSTTELMTTVFRAHASQPTLDRAEALRRARLHLIDEAAYLDSNLNPLFSYAHPIFWAPFTIVGDGGGGSVVNQLPGS